MIRIAWMLLRNIHRLPGWFYSIIKMGSPEDTHTETERYGYLRQIVDKLNHTGNVRLVEHGAENLPEQDGFILFPNHQGLYDMLALIGSCPHPISIVIKKEAEKMVLVREVIALLHGLYIDRSDMRASLKVINQVTEEVKEGRNYVIFAEGTRSHDGNTMLKFKGGTFKSAVNARCPIVPVALFDSYRAFDINSIKEETVHVHYLDPIPYDQYVGLKTVEIADLVESRIRQKIEENMLKKWA